MEQSFNIKHINQIQINNFSKESLDVHQNQFFYNIDNLDDQQFIAKVLATPINPLDLQKMSGAMVGLKLPLTLGSECSATIIYAKSGSEASKYIGKKISMSGEGCWSDYVLGTLNNTIILNDQSDPIQTACGYVNPMTCMGLIEQAEQRGAKAIINLAAGSALGKMIIKTAALKNIQVINVVRTSEKVFQLKQQVSTNYVLDFLDEGFDHQLKELSEKLQATVCFDPIGGELTGRVFNAMPPNSTIIVYGSLSGKDISGINGVQVRWANKKLEGFVIFRWFSQKTKEQKEQIKEFIKNNFVQLFIPDIQQVFPFNDIKKAMDLYQRNMSGGKVILIPPESNEKKIQ